MALPDVYRATIQAQQRELAALVKSAGVAPLKKIYDEALQDIERKLSRISSASFDEAQMQGMLAQIKIGLAGLVQDMSGEVNAAAFRVGINSARATLNHVARLEKQFSGAYRPLPLRELARLEGQIKGESSSLLKYHTASMLRYGSATVSTFERELRSALVTGETGTQAIDRIAAAGQMEWYRAERIVRTELAYSSNASIRATNNAQAAELDGDMWSRWSEHVSDDGSPLDDRVGEDSEAMHGQVAPPGGMFTQPPMTPAGEEVSKTLVGDQWAHPPNRPNDRAVLTPWRAHWGVPGWIWQGGKRVPATPELVAEINGGGKPTPGAVANANQPEPAPAPEPEARRAPPTPGAADRFAAAAQSKDISSARSAAETALTEMGFASRGDPMTKTRVGRVPARASAYRAWDGEIVMRKDYAKGAQDFMATWRKDAADTRAKLEAYAKARTRAYNGTPITAEEAPALREALMNGNEAFVNASRYKTLVHETMHGFGPVQQAGYAGYGVHVEEVTTEVMARTLVREHYGADMHAVMDVNGKLSIGAGSGSYEGYIQASIKSIRETTGLDHAEALKLLERSAAEFKRRPYGGGEPIHVFVDAVATAGDKIDRDKLRKALESNWKKAKP